MTERTQHPGQPDRAVAALIEAAEKHNAAVANGQCDDIDPAIIAAARLGSGQPVLSGLDQWNAALDVAMEAVAVLPNWSGTEDPLLNRSAVLNALLASRRIVVTVPVAEPPDHDYTTFGNGTVCCPVAPERHPGRAVPVAEPLARADTWHAEARERWSRGVPPPVDPDEWTALANDIRIVDGNHDLGAGALAERLIQRGWGRAVPVAEEGLREAAEQAFHWFAMSAGEYFAHYGHNNEPIDVLRTALASSSDADTLKPEPDR